MTPMFLIKHLLFMIMEGGHLLTIITVSQKWIGSNKIHLNPHIENAA